MTAWQLGVAEISSLVRSRQLSPAELVRSLVERSRALDGDLRAWATLDADGAIAAAEALTARVAAGQPVGPLAGVPLAIKDVIDVAGLPTTASSKVLQGNIAEADASCIERLRSADAIVLGKAHTAEFAGPDAAPTRNPWNPEHTPGGSSSGPAVAVAAGLAPAALGTQTGGSTLRPAAYTGVVGLKPTYGAISNRGVIPLSWSLDHVGIMARSVEDVATVFAAVAGHDPLDPASSPRADRCAATDARATARPSAIGVLTDPFFGQVDPVVRDATERAIERLAAGGAELREMTLGGALLEINEQMDAILGAETYAYHRPLWESHRDLYGPKLSERLAEISTRTVADYVLAQRRRPTLVAALEAALEGIDIALTPSTPAPPPRDTTQTGDASFQMVWSYSGLPTISLPTGVDANGLPTAIQLVGHRWRDGELLAFARWCERMLGFDAHPPCWTGG